MSNEKKTCFVVMGFGKKTDYPTGRVLDLDRSYHNMIKPAVERAGLECIRADEIVHAGSIDEKMFTLLLDADVVVADLSTANPNAFYELGVRHALRPYTTIIIAEKKFTYPFDINHIAIRSYEHLGDDIGYSQAVEFQEQMKKAILDIVNKQPQPDNDSPVYLYIKNLKRVMAEEAAADEAGGAAKTEAAAAAQPPGAGQSLSALMQAADKLIANADGAKDFLNAKFKLEEARAMAQAMAQAPPPEGATVSADGPTRQEDPYIIQRLALATYKSKFPSVVEALKEAHGLLLALDPHTSNDPETLGLWGAIHKRLWEELGERKYLDEAILAYERGFYMRDDYYNGINLAFLLNLRAAKRENRAESIADFVLAQRVRREVVRICARELAELDNQQQNVSEPTALAKYRDTRYWIQATLAEAHVGLGDEAAAGESLKAAHAVAAANWMKESTDTQIGKLRPLMADSPLKYVNPEAA